MASSSEIARAYFDALSDQDLDRAVALWKPGAPDRIVGQGEHVAPDGLRAFLGELLEVFPDWHNEVLETTAQRGRCAVRWRATATFTGPGRLEGFAANGRSVEIEGCDVLTVVDDQITSSHVFLDRADLFGQLGLVPGSGAEPGRATPPDAPRTRRRRRTGGSVKVIAPGVWLLSAGFPASYNVYLLAEEGGGVTAFDAGIRSMAPAIAAAAARLGGLRRVVLSHADADHRGGAAGQGVPVFTHPLEVEAAQSAEHRRPYWDLTKLRPYARPIYPLLFRSWDGGALEVAGTVQEGDEIAGFRVVDLPGHAPGLIGLFREEDGLALCSDTIYTLDVETGVPGGPRVPHEAFNFNTLQAQASVLKLAALEPRVVWAGHSRPVSGPGIAERLVTVGRA
jgi:hydroxyacylglutathione hydrolase